MILEDLIALRSFQRIKLHAKLLAAPAFHRVGAFFPDWPPPMRALWAALGGVRKPAASKAGNTPRMRLWPVPQPGIACIRVCVAPRPMLE